MKKIVVASTNPVKIKTTEVGFAKMFPDETFKVEGVSAKSEVPDQPLYRFCDMGGHLFGLG